MKNRPNNSSLSRENNKIPNAVMLRAYDVSVKEELSYSLQLPRVKEEIISHCGTCKDL